MIKKVNNVKRVVKDNALSRAQIINLMSIYGSEWQHRDDILWSQIFKLFYATLLVIILPNISSKIGLCLPDINLKLFPVIGLMMSFVVFYIGMGYAVRLKASGDTYVHLMKMLKNKDGERFSIRDREKYKYAWIFSGRLAFILVFMLTFALILISLVFLVF